MKLHIRFEAVLVVKSKEITLEDADQMVTGLSTTLKYLCDVGDARSIPVIQGSLGQATVAQRYLQVGTKVWWAYPDYDLELDDGKKIEVKSIKLYDGDWNMLLGVKVGTRWQKS